MSREARFYLEDIVQSCVRVSRYVDDLDFSQFKRDEKTYDAVMRNLEIIGEATKNISEEIRQAYPDVEWRKIAGLRDIVAHEYFGINDEIVWDVIKNKLPPLHAHVSMILGDLD